MIYKDNESLLGWRILGNPTVQNIKDKHLRNSKTLHTIIYETPSKIKLISDANMKMLQDEVEEAHILDNDMRKTIFIQETRNKHINLPRPLGNLNITVCNILNSKGLGADIVFVVGFDEGKFPSKSTPSESEIYQMLVALTRAKKRIYFINTIDKKVSSFLNYIDKKDLEIEGV